MSCGARLRGAAITALCVGALVAAGSCSASAPTPRGTRPAPAVQPLAQGRDPAYDSPAWHRYQQELVALSRSADSSDQYQLAYGVNAHVAAFRATGDRRHLDAALGLVDNVVGSARRSSDLPTSQFRDGYLGWVTQRPEVQGQEVPLYESYLWRYVTQMLRVIRTDPAVFADQHYRGEYERLLAFSERELFDKWSRRGMQFLYRDRTHMAAHWAFIALDLSTLTTDGHRRATYLRVVSQFDALLVGQLRRNPADAAAWFWNDKWALDARPGQDVGHGNGVMAYVTEAVDLGSGPWRHYIPGFVNLLSDVVLRPDGRAAEFVDGSGSGNGWLADGFVTLGRYSAPLQRRLVMLPSGRTPQFLANLALNSAYLAAPANG